MKKNGMVWILCLFFILFCPRSVYAEEFVSTKNGLDVMFVMDYSGSMKTNDSQDIARGMVKAFVDTVHSADIRVHTMTVFLRLPPRLRYRLRRRGRS